MESSQRLTAKEAQRRLLFSYREGNAGGFLEFMKRPFLNPIEQRDEKNRRKLHPLFATGMILLAVAVAAAFYFRH
ncbi:MAG TPA: hypothetical protein VMU57_10685 [Edaphobacter sp.]|uniref:hypothetical protein n=1 Tax=Edaphobacter sp. TaxID=1934404 RepID=UPI002B52D8E6|nr:hypothetical protein [Edaphobacter sp.]HUZ95369.1 hypothetical protein [Edaphobacter sp.]